jgi:rhamnose transport system substrate-binding protein
MIEHRNSTSSHPSKGTKMLPHTSKRRILKHALGIGAGVVALALVATGCSSGSGGGSTSGGDKNYKISFLPKNLGNPYFDTSDKGGQTAVKSFGGTYNQVGPSTATADAQVSYINTLTQQGVGAIVLSANDPTALGSALTQAKSSNVKIVTFDSDTDPKFRDVFVNQATAAGIAKVQVDTITKEIGDSGEVAILSAAANATNQNAWIDLMKTDLAKNHPNVKLVDTVYGNDDDQTSFDKTAALLQTHPNLKGIVSPTTVGIAAAARYLSTSAFKGKVKLTGLGTPNQMREFVKDGTVDEFALWNPEDLGYLAAFTAKALIDGTITGKKGDSFEAGKLGKFTVGDNATVLLGDPFVFNKDNIDKFNF